MSGTGVGCLSVMVFTPSVAALVWVDFEEPKHPNPLTPKHILKKLIESTAVCGEPLVEHGPDLVGIAS